MELFLHQGALREGAFTSCRKRKGRRDRTLISCRKRKGPVPAGLVDIFAFCTKIHSFFWGTPFSLGALLAPRMSSRGTPLHHLLSANKLATLSS